MVPRRAALFALVLCAAASCGGDDSTGPLEPSPETPRLDSISPSQAWMGDSTVSMTLWGAGFTTRSEARWDGATLATVWVSATQLGATVALERLVDPDTVQVTVFDTRHGLESSPRSFNVLRRPRPTCADTTGTLHAGVVGDEAWSERDSPHQVTDTLRVGGSLQLLPGALLCLAPAVPVVILREGSLRVVGTADSLVVLTAQDPERPWGGIRHEEVMGVGSGITSLTMRHAVVEHAEVGIGLFGANLYGTVDSTRFRQIQGTALSNHTYTDVVVDSACLKGGPWCTAAQGHGYWGAPTVLGDVVVRGSGWGGVGCPAQLNGVRILGSAGPGILGCGGPWYRLSVTGSIRITGGAGYPAELGTGNLAWVLANVDSLLGNARDTLVIAVTDNRVSVDATVPVQLPFKIKHRVPQRGLTLTLTEGSSAHFVDGSAKYTTLLGPESGDATISGNLGNPYELTLRDLRAVNASATVEIETDVHAVRMDSSTLSFGHGTVRATVLERSSLIVTGDFYASAVTLDSVSVIDAPGAGIHITRRELQPLVDVTNCRVTGSGAAGILVEGAANVTLSSCDVYGNAGAGVANRGSGTVQASGNWWGDPLGPDGPNGDGIEGAVLVGEVRTTPVFPDTTSSGGS